MTTPTSLPSKTPNVSQKRVQPQEDGALQPALTHLTDTVTALTHPQPHTIDNQLHWLDSRYQQLRDSLPGSQGDHHGVPRSLPACWIDALDLLMEIDTAAICWGGNGTNTPTRLQTLTTRKWRPQDTRGIQQIADACHSWTQSIDRLLTDPHIQEISAPCPNCNATSIRTRDSAGEMVRRAALQLTTNECICGNCHTHWPQERFELLALAIGCIPITRMAV